MIRRRLAQIIQEAVASMPPAPWPTVEVSDTKSPEHGDFATSFCLQAAKSAGRNPRELASELAAILSGRPEFAKVEAAGPGFLNMTVTTEFLNSFVAEVVADPSGGYARLQSDKSQRVNVEFVSVNPNGPITIGSGRGAAYGSALCNVLESCGHTVHREYYINDGVNSEQMRLFAESVKALAHSEPLPEKGYKGDYVQAVADQIGASSQAEVGWWQDRSQELMIEAQREALSAFGVSFDTWFSEQSLHDRGMVDACLADLTEKGIADTEPYRTVVKAGKKGEAPEVIREPQDQVKADEEEGAGEGSGETLWLRSTQLGDDMDRVLRRRDGRLTYIASDVAYHKDKFNRPPNADLLITVLGPDHHGYIGRLRAVVAALSFDLGPERALELAKQRLTVQIFQLVRFMKDGQPAPMRKRDGNIYALIDLMKEIGDKVRPSGSEEERLAAGRDVARFFYLMRHHDTTFDFDLDLAQRQSDDNPVFYVQYAHARICSVVSKAEAAGINASASASLDHPRERALALKILDLPSEIERTGEDYAVNRIATYAIELARTYHHFYDACRVVEPSAPEVSSGRLALCLAARTALASACRLLGVSAPERMDRDEPDPG